MEVIYNIPPVTVKVYLTYRKELAYVEKPFSATSLHSSISEETSIRQPSCGLPSITILLTVTVMLVEGTSVPTSTIST